MAVSKAELIKQKSKEAREQRKLETQEKGDSILDEIVSWQEENFPIAGDASPATAQGAKDGAAEASTDGAYVIPELRDSIKEKLVTISIRLEPEVKRQIDSISEQNNVSISKAACYLIDLGFKALKD